MDMLLGYYLFLRRNAERLADDLRAMKGRIGPCKRLGMYTGGGLPYGEFARYVRSIPGVQESFLHVLRLDERYVADVPYVVTPQALLLAMKGKKSLLELHRDNDFIPNCPMAFRLQGSITQFPPTSKRFTRTAALYSMVPATEPVVRAFTTALCTRDSMCASGAIAKG